MHSAPESNDQWIGFALPEVFLEHARKHEDKTMVAKWAFTKPALTYTHLAHVVEVCENHYLHV